MAYRLALDTDPPDALRDAAREQLDDAVRRLRDGAEGDPAKAVHEARKDVKKTRSLLRLARPGLKRKAYRRENAALRDGGRLLSGTRDADVLVATAVDLGERFAGQVPAEMFEAMHARLAAEAAAAHRGEGSGAEAAAALEAVRARVDDWPLAGSDHDTLVRGAVRAYERGREATALATRDPSVESLHSLRKRVKDLWYHARLLEAAWPRVLEAQSKAAHDLSDLLGDDHDLAVLAERVRRGFGGATDAPVDEDAVIDLIGRRRGELQAEAMRIARRLYAEPAKAFGRRLGRYVELGRADRRVAEPA